MEWRGVEGGGFAAHIPHPGFCAAAERIDFVFFGLCFLKILSRRGMRDEGGGLNFHDFARNYLI